MMCGGPAHQKKTHLQIPPVEDQEGLRYRLLTDNFQNVTFSSAENRIIIIHEFHVLKMIRGKKFKTALDKRVRCLFFRCG